MNLKKFEMRETAILHLRDAADALMYADGENGEPDLAKPMRIQLYGPGTRPHAKAQTVRTNRTVMRLQRKGKVDMSADEAIAEAAEFLTACTKGMENIESEKGATGEDLFIEVYSNLKLTFIAQQAENFARNTENFKPDSTTS